MVYNKISTNTINFIMNKAEQLFKKCPDEFDQQLFSACRDGDLDFIRLFTSSSYLKNNITASHVWRMLEESSKNNHVDVLREFFNCSKLFDMKSIKTVKELIFRVACANNQINVLKYLFDEQKDTVLDGYEIVLEMRSIIKNDSIELMKYLVKQERVLLLEVQYAYILRATLEFDKLEATRWLIENIENDAGLPYFNSHLHKLFLKDKKACELFVVELNIAENTPIKNFFYENKKSYLETVFKLKNLNKSLDKSLENNNNTIIVKRKI
jgi:hypothetical protein